MANMKTVRRRIVSVRSTRQIVKAMNLVAASKFQKMRTKLSEMRPLVSGIRRVISEAGTTGEAKENIFFTERGEGSPVYLVVTSDRGLCGGYNINVTEEALKRIGPRGDAMIISLGLRGYEYLKYKGIDTLMKFGGISETVLYEDAERVGEYVRELYLSGKCNEVYLAFTRFDSVLTHTPVIEMLLPIHSLGKSDSRSYERQGAVKYEPSAEMFLDHIIPMYMDICIHGALVEASISEQAARMVSMESASSNADEIIGKLSLEYNRERQTTVTQELNEIIAGAMEWSTPIDNRTPPPSPSRFKASR